MDSITIRLIRKKFQVPPEVMSIIDGYLLDIYKEEHRQKLIDDLKFILEKVNNPYLRKLLNPYILNNMDIYIQYINKNIYDTDYEDYSDFDDYDEDYEKIGYIIKRAEISLENHKMRERARRNPKLRKLLMDI
jgi:hypothetical protein